MKFGRDFFNNPVIQSPTGSMNTITTLTSFWFTSCDNLTGVEFTVGGGDIGVEQKELENGGGGG